MDKKKRYLFYINLSISCIAVIFIATAIGTEYWVTSDAVRNVEDDVKDVIRNRTDGETGTRLTGYLHFGLFGGYKEIDYALGLRTGDIKIDCVPKENLCGYVWADRETLESQSLRLRIQTYNEAVIAAAESNTTAKPADLGLFSYSLWVLTIIFAAIAIVWGIVAMVFSAINAGMRPIETITGPLGLYIWNSCAALFSLLCMIMYISLFLVDLSENVMTPDDLELFWSSDGLASLGYSFYFIVIATVLFLLNLVILALMRTECRSSRYSARMGEKGMDGVMMY